MNLKTSYKSKFFPSFIFFTLFAIQLFAIFFDYGQLQEICELIVGPVLLILYLNIFRKKASVIFVLAYIILILGDYLYLILPNGYTSHNYVMVNNIVFISIIIGFSIRDYLVIKKIKIDWLIGLSLLISISFFFYVYYYLNSLFSAYYDSNFYIFFLIYGFLLFLSLSISILNLCILPNDKHINLTFAVVSFVMADIFFAVDFYYISLYTFQVLIFILHFIAYFMFYIYEVSRMRNSINNL